MKTAIYDQKQQHLIDAENAGYCVRLDFFQYIIIFDISNFDHFWAQARLSRFVLLCLFCSPRLPRLVAPLASLALMIQTLTRTLPDTSDTSKTEFTDRKKNFLYSLCPCGHWLIEADIREAVPGPTWITNNIFMNSHSRTIIVKRNIDLTEVLLERGAVIAGGRPTHTWWLHVINYLSVSLIWPGPE